MNIFFDESRNTGEIGINGTNLNFFEQRYFVLVGYIDNAALTNDYEVFKRKNIRKIYPNSDEKEIKGSDLLTKKTNEILDEFIQNFFNNDNLLITVYDKKFFVVASLLVWLFGIPFKDKEPVKFFTFCEFLIKIDDLFLVNFIKVSNQNTIDNIDEFIDFFESYEFNECINVSFEQEIKKELKSAIIEFRKHDNYLKLLQEDVILENIRVRGKKRNNIVNLTALGETVLLLKHSQGIKNEEIHIYHDNIEIVETYIKHYFNQIPVKFLDSKDSIQIQLADNVSSVIGKFINKILPVKSDNSIKDSLNKDSIWIRKRLTKVFAAMNQNNIKLVMSLREQAFVKTYCLTTIQDFQQFKMHLFRNIDKSFNTELLRHISAEQVYDLFTK